jgi:1,4-alpha-glucan branching enzyme
VFAFLRNAPDQPTVLVVSNMTPVPRHDYRIGVPHDGGWREIFNSDSGYYGGSNVGNDGRVESSAFAAHGHSQSLGLNLPPLATIFLRHEG